jgi:ATP-dependent Clp protease ATP-binding subunit ClpC
MSRRRVAASPVDRTAFERECAEVEALLRTGHWEPARERAEALVAEHPSLSVAHSLLSRALFYMGHSTRAVLAAERARDLAPSDAQTLARLGGMYAAVGRVDEAIERCREALAIDDRDPSARVNLALALVRADRCDEAIEALSALAGRGTLAASARKSALDLLGELPDDRRTRALREAIEATTPDEQQAAPPAVLASSQRATSGHDSALDRVGRDLCALARAGRLERATGRDDELEQLIDVLARRRKSNPCLVGPAGVGKTAIVEALAHRIAEGRVAPALRGARIVEVSMASLTAGTSLRGELESRLQRILEELRERRSTILFLDEVHTLVASAAPGQLSVAEVLKPAMARGELSLIGATTDEGYERTIQRDPALARRFERVSVREPDERSLRAILRASATEFGRHHGVSIDDERIDECRTLASQWLADRRMPDVGVDVLDRACVRAARDRAARVSSEHVLATIATMASSTVDQLRATPGALSARARSALTSAVIGHEAALRSLASAVSLSAMRDASQRRPRAVLYLLGPSSVGKHCALRALSAALDRPIVQFDLASVSERHDLAKLVGTSAGYVGYDDGAPLLRALRAQPNAIVCLDNPEQAHPDARAMLASALRDAALTDARGDSADLRRAMVVLVTHRAESTRSRPGFSLTNVKAELAQAAELLGASLAATLDATVSFEPLSRDDRRALARRFIDDGGATLASHAIQLRVEESAIELLLDGASNARELRARCERELFAAAIELATRADLTIVARAVEGRLSCAIE